MLDAATMKSFYFIQVNIICVIFLTFINHKTASKKKASLSDKTFRFSVFSSELLCISDGILGLVDGRIFFGSIFINHLFNMLYFSSGTFTAMGWLFFVCTKLSKRLTKKFMCLLSIPYVIVQLLILSNPLTHWVFTITEANVYIRGSLLWCQWGAVVFYLLFATGISINATRKEYNKIIKNICLSYCYFGIFPLVGFALQVFVYGITTTTVGVALGYLFYYVKSLENQISEDSLTGLNNRRQMEKYVSDLIYRDSDSQMFVIMMDLNGFKAINDNLGHTTGDLALRDFADALRMACRKWRGHYMLCRYGGDEFAVVGEVLPDTDIQVFVNLIRESVSSIGGARNRDYVLSTSIGTVIGVCKKTEDFTHLYKEADKRMYEDKMLQKAKLNVMNRS